MAARTRTPKAVLQSLASTAARRQGAAGASSLLRRVRTRLDVRIWRQAVAMVRVCLPPLSVEQAAHPGWAVDDERIYQDNLHIVDQLHWESHRQEDELEPAHHLLYHQWDLS